MKTFASRRADSVENKRIAQRVNRRIFTNVIIYGAKWGC